MNYPEYVSQELDFTKVNPAEYEFPTEFYEEVECVLDCRYWTNPKDNACCVLLLTTKDNRKLKIFVFRHRATQNYNPTKQIKTDFCVRNDLSLNDKLLITYGRSKNPKSINTYLREIIFVNQQ